MLVYLLRDAFLRKQITLSKDSSACALTMRVPSEYKMLEDGIYALTPELFRHSSSAEDSPSWNLGEQTRSLSIEGYNNTFVDVVGRLLIRSVLCSKNEQQVNRCVVYRFSQA